MGSSRVSGVSLYILQEVNGCFVVQNVQGFVQ